MSRTPGWRARDTSTRPGLQTAFPPVPLRFSTYGVEAEQAVEIPGAPEVEGFTRSQCERALGA